VKGVIALAAASALGAVVAWIASNRESKSDGVGVGDGATSEIDASLFFETLDVDADGQIERDELESYVGGAIGGHVLDSFEEIDAGVASIFASADLDADAQLSAADMREYWTMLGSLLSVVEVGAWVEHAAQLPHDVAQLFVDTSVSGYDFAELARDTTESGALKTEVGVRTQRQRNTLARAMRMRLTGVGRTPTSSLPLIALGSPKCTSVHLAWATADGGGFPTHKYLVERRATTSRHPGHNAAHHPSSTLHGTSRDDRAWTIVADGYFHEFIDEDLVPGIGYDYRIAAWNAIGRGNYVVAHLPVTVRAPCQPFEYLGAWALPPIAKLVHSGLVVARFAVTALVFFFAVLRLVNYGARPNEFHPIFLTLSAFFGVIFRYTPFTCDLLLLVNTALSTKPIAIHQVTHHPGESSPLLLDTAALKDTLPPEMSLPAHCASQRVFFDSNTLTSPSSTTRNEKPNYRKTALCSSCRRPFITGFRSRHYCYVCAASFCRQCGIVKHSHMITCPVGSKCCCARCLHDQTKTLCPKLKPLANRQLDYALPLPAATSGDPPPQRTSSVVA